MRRRVDNKKKPDQICSRRIASVIGEARLVGWLLVQEIIECADSRPSNFMAHSITRVINCADAVASLRSVENALLSLGTLY